MKRKGNISESGKLLILGIGILLILAIIVIILVVRMKDDVRKRDAVVEILQQEIQEDGEGQEASGGETADGQEAAGQENATDGGAEDGTLQDETAQAAGDEAQNGEKNSSVQVGALEDEEDPQEQNADVNAGGVAVTVTQGTGNAVSKSENETGQQSMGIDVSKHQGNIDWAKVKASGVEFAMVRVGYRAKSTGQLYEDPAARYNLQEAQAAGIRLGAYFFSSAMTEEEAREEARFTTDLIAKYKITYPVAYNCEGFQDAGNRQYALSQTERTSLACAFLDEVAAAGYTPMFYASRNELAGNASWDTDTLASRYKIWLAWYPGTVTEKADYSGSYAMWQYTCQGTVDGISGKTDVNTAYFSYTKEAEAKDETPAEKVTVNPEVGINFTEVNETVTAKQETNLRSVPSTASDDTIVGRLTHGDTATRIGIGHNGWSKVIYQGQTLYAVTSYLTTNMEDTGQQAPPQGPVYTPTGDQVTAKMETNLRTEPSTASDDTIVGKLHNGEVLIRIATGDNGWSQLDYNGQTVYAVSSYLMPAG